MLPIACMKCVTGARDTSWPTSSKRKQNSPVASDVQPIIRGDLRKKPRRRLNFTLLNVRFPNSPSTALGRKQTLAIDRLRPKTDIDREHLRTHSVLEPKAHFAVRNRSIHRDHAFTIEHPSLALQTGNRAVACLAHIPHVLEGPSVPMPPPPL